MDIEVVRRICLARHLYELGSSGLKSANDLYVFSASNLMQDAVEVFLLAVADFLGVSIVQNSNFEKYFTSINEKIAPKELPFKNKLVRLNKIRVNSKHYGIQPEREECERLSIAVREFFEEVSNSILGVSFSTISAIDLLTDGETKNFLLQAKDHLEKNEYESCSISCRKAIFLEVEKNYDISEFKNGAEPKGLLEALSDAPYFTKNKDYIEKHVAEPTDYIVLDHSHLDQKLLKYSVDNTAYWNVWRLTPAVYKNKAEEWIVKYEFDKLNDKILQENIEYIFNTTVDIIFSIHTTKQNIKSKDYIFFNLELVSDEVPVFEKADKTSKIIGKTPKDLLVIDCVYHITGLNGDGPYWKIRHIEEGNFLFGYIHNDYVK